MAKTYIFEHKNPDTDAISSAIIMADFEQQTGNSEATPYRLGEIGPETQFALDHFNVETPELLNDNLADQNVILVDHNEFQQSADSIADAAIQHVVDHHRISNFEDRKSTRLNSSHVSISYAVFCLKKKKNM